MDDYYFSDTKEQNDKFEASKHALRGAVRRECMSYILDLPRGPSLPWYMSVDGAIPKESSSFMF